MVAVASGIVLGLQACGGFKDNKNLASVLAATSSLNVFTNTGGGTLTANTVVFVLDGQPVSLPSNPVSGNVVIVVNIMPAIALTVSANVGGPWQVTHCMGFSYSGSAWVPNGT
jgi:hypothetical protein